MHALSVTCQDKPISLEEAADYILFAVETNCCTRHPKKLEIARTFSSIFRYDCLASLHKTRRCKHIYSVSSFKRLSKLINMCGQVTVNRLPDYQYMFCFWKRTVVLTEIEKQLLNANQSLNQKYDEANFADIYSVKQASAKRSLSISKITLYITAF